MSLALVISLVLAITTYTHFYGTRTDQIFWYMVCFFFLPVLFWLLSISSKLFLHIKQKLQIMVYGVYYFCLSKDGISSKKLKQIPDADLIKPSLAKKKYPEKRIIFIRHGESDWNLIFNKVSPCLVVSFIL
jgi:hypothetical protein